MPSGVETPAAFLKRLFQFDSRDLPPFGGWAGGDRIAEVFNPMDSNPTN
jgi:hypothetical protein